MSNMLYTNWDIPDESGKMECSSNWVAVTLSQQGVDESP